MGVLMQEEWTAEQLAQSAFDMRLLDRNQLDSVWAEFRTQDVSFDDFSSRLQAKGLLTNLQIDKLLKGDREGFFYGKYRVLYMIGAGTFARVYRAVHTESERVVALKVLRKRFRGEPDQVEQFLREAKMGERLKHINIVRVHDVSDDIRAPYMVMDFVEGQSLREFMKVRKKLDVGTALAIITDIVSGLDYARKQGITHRDLKLSNVLINSKGRAKLVDFGLATISEGDDKSLNASPNARAIDYVALERGTNVRKNDHRSDIYFSGCIFYNLLTGTSPLVETRDRLLRMSIGRFHEVTPVNKVKPDLPIYVVAIVNKSMALRPEQRYQEPIEMLIDLNQAAERLDKGEDAEWSGVDEETKAKQKAKVIDREGDGLTVMLVESEMDLQDLLREKLKKRGYRVLITSDPDRAVNRLLDDPDCANCVVLSTQQLGSRALKAFNTLGEKEATVDVPAILLIDKKQRELIQAAKRAPHRVLMGMPLKMLTLRKILRKLLSENQAE